MSTISFTQWNKWISLTILKSTPIFIFVGLLMPLSVWSQQFPSDFPPTLKNYPFFNTEFVHSKGIKSIHTKVMFKSPMQKIVYSLESDSFRFNELGRVVFHQKNHSNGDTTTTQFKANKLNLVTQEVIKSKHRNVKISYVINDHNDVIEINEIDNRTGLELQNEKFKFLYEYYDQYKKYWLNSDGLSYKYSIIKLDDKKRIIEERGRYLQGTSKHSIYYKYENDLLVDYSSNIKEMSRREVKFIMIYDSTDLLVEMNEYRDGAYIHHHELLYENGLLIAILEKNIRTQRIKIIKFKYEML